ncbi:MAG: nucleotidyltransferase family protein [Elusimicrobia bacterium]|nr:nucleotidyltransferase family protein [Elusimicrobiota bacterium]
MSTKLTKENIIELLKEVDTEVLQKYKAHLRGIFGSFAKGQAKENSDIDVLVDFEEDANLLHLVGLSNFLEEKLQRHVDVVPADVIRKEIKGIILKEAVYL